MKSLEDFTITKETFKEVCDYASEFFTPIFIFNAAIVLPFYVPFPEGAQSLKIVPDLQYFAFMKFRKIDYEVACVTPGLTNSLSVQGIHDNIETRSFVEMAFITVENLLDESTRAKLAGQIMNVLLNHLNKTLTAFSFLSNNTGVYPITRNMLPYVTISQVLDCVNFDVKKVIPIATNTSYEADMMLKAMKIDDNHVREVLAYESELKARFQTSELFAFDALRHFRNGLLKESVISINTAVESFLFSIFIELKIVDGVVEESAMQSAADMKLHNLFKHEAHLKARIGGTWETSGEESECARWYSSAYSLRNNIVHSGYEPSSAEAYNALKAALQFREYVFNLMTDHHGTYKSVSDNLNRFYKLSKKTFATTVFETELSYDDEKRTRVLNKSLELAHELILKEENPEEKNEN